MSNLGADGRPTARFSRAANYHWHTDKPYHRAPPLMTMLYAVELPPAGGDTAFANMAHALVATLGRKTVGAPVTLILRRPGKIFVRFDGFQDQASVAQATANAALS